MFMETGFQEMCFEFKIYESYVLLQTGSRYKYLKSKVIQQSVKPSTTTYYKYNASWTLDEAFRRIISNKRININIIFKYIVFFTSYPLFK